MTIFPHNQPKLTKDDRDRLLPNIANARVPLNAWLKTNPPLEDLKKALILEVERAKQQYDPFHSLRRGVLPALLKRIQNVELSIIDANIREELKGVEK